MVMVSGWRKGAQYTAGGEEGAQRRPGHGAFKVKGWGWTLQSLAREQEQTE